jgi:hypothetical protein
MSSNYLVLVSFYLDSHQPTLNPFNKVGKSLNIYYFFQPRNLVHIFFLVEEIAKYCTVDYFQPVFSTIFLNSKVITKLPLNNSNSQKIYSL